MDHSQPGAQMAQMASISTAIPLEVVYDDDHDENDPHESIARKPNEDASSSDDSSSSALGTQEETGSMTREAVLPPVSASMIKTRPHSRNTAATDISPARCDARTKNENEKNSDNNISININTGPKADSPVAVGWSIDDTDVDVDAHTHAHAHAHALPENFNNSPEPIHSINSVKKTNKNTNTHTHTHTHQPTFFSPGSPQQEKSLHPSSPERRRVTAFGYKNSSTSLSSSFSGSHSQLSQIQENTVTAQDVGILQSSSSPSISTSTIGSAASTSLNDVNDVGNDNANNNSNNNDNDFRFRSPNHQPQQQQQQQPQQQNRYFTPSYTSTKYICAISEKIFQKEDFALATWIGFWSLLIVTMGVSTITPIRDAVALQVGVKHMPKLTLASSVLAFLSSVPIGWLFEAPDPSRRKLWKKMGLTRGATQGSSLALFYRFFAFSVASYAVGFTLVDLIHADYISLSWLTRHFLSDDVATDATTTYATDNYTSALGSLFREWIPRIWGKLGEIMYIAFFLVVHLMKLHSISLVWGVTTEAMEYEDVARNTKHAKESQSQLHTNKDNAHDNGIANPKIKTRTRLQRLALVGFGGTLGGILGSILASELVNHIHLPGLLIVSAVLLEIAAQLSIELGQIMQKHWEEQQIFKSSQDLASLDPSMKRSASLGSMKRVASGNSLMKRVSSNASINHSTSAKSLASLDSNSNNSSTPGATPVIEITDNTFTQRLLRGITTILKSRLLMAIFTYNALFASTTVLLSFQRAELVANRSSEETSVAADTAFLAKINMASSIAVFTMQASGIGAIVAHTLGPQGSLALMPIIRLMGVTSLAWWHRTSNGQAPNLILFLILDECTRVVNLAVAKPVRESLWRGLSNEARYEAKPIVDTLANRWGAGSASFCVSAITRVLIWLGNPDASMNGEILGLPPIIFLCLLVAAWWAMVSLDLGQIRKRIDLELKKRQ